MSVLFAPKRRKLNSNVSNISNVEKSSLSSTNNEEFEKSKVMMMVSSETKKKETLDCLQSFSNLGLAKCLVDACAAMGIRKPTPVQSTCIPWIIAGKDVIGCAQTGSGKTAAFALPILHVLAQDPYGPFAVVLTPTRELAFQIAEQFRAFGSCIGLRECVVVGGIDMLAQSIELEKRPHVIIATPGRLRDHLMRATPPKLNKVKFLVLDEADRLLEETFSSDLEEIISNLPNSRQTLLFSATMTSHVKELESSLKDPLRFDALPTATTVKSLFQQYLFMPSQIKTCYLMYLLSHFGPSSVVEECENETVQSAIIFVATKKTCQLLSEIITELGMNCVALHSLLSQKRRLAVCTDVASRGLDIPQVDLVVNYDIPRSAEDYIHRVGRTARAGRKGRAVSLVTQYDIALLQHIEKVIEKKLVLFDEITEDLVLKQLSQVTKATRVAKMKLASYGFDEKALHVSARNKRNKSKNIETTAE